VVVLTELRAFPAALEIRAGGDGRTVTGLVAPFHMPTSIGGRFTEVFGPGSFRLAPVPLHSGHPRDDRDMPVSPPGRVWEEPAGVTGEWHLSRTTAANDLLELLGDRAVSGLSVGFAPDEDADLWSGDGQLVTRRGAELLHVAAVPRAAYTAARVTSVRAGLSAADVNDLPDSDFAWIQPGGTKDEQGRTVPRSLRHLPVHDAAHVRDALARLNQTQIPARARQIALGRIKATAKRFGVEVADDRARVTIAGRAALEALDRRRALDRAAERACSPGGPARFTRELANWQRAVLRRLLAGGEVSLGDLEKLAPGAGPLLEFTDLLSIDMRCVHRSVLPGRRPGRMLSVTDPVQVRRMLGYDDDAGPAAG
jgi:HK97 family phage prohead protease